MATAVEIVEFALGRRVVHVERRHEQLAQAVQLVEAVHAGRRLLGHALPLLDQLVEDVRVLGVDLLEQVLDDRLLVAARGAVHPVVALFEFVALVEQQRHVAAVVDDHLRTLALGVDQRLPGAVPVFFQRLALPGEHRHAGLGDGGGGVVLGGEDVAARPAHVGAQVHERLDQHGRLDGHVQGARDADPGEGLFGRVLLADGDQARHFFFGDVDLLAAEIGQREVAHGEILVGGDGGSVDGSGAHGSKFLD